MFVVVPCSHSIVTKSSCIGWNNFLTDKSTYAVLDVKEGDILVVPSFVNHFTQQNKSKSEKRIISWDMKDASTINR